MDAVLHEIDIPIIGALVALIVAEIAEQTWTELGRRESTYGAVSEAVSYASRGPSGATATLSGLVAMPDVGDAPDYQRPGRIVVLTHGTGATPSGLSPHDGWYVLANLLAGRGYLVVAPDNWGRGVSGAPERPETYLMANRTANNALDMIRAVLADGRYEAFHDALETVPAALVGYSQGAHSAVALWLASAAGTQGTQKVAIREVYAGGGPHNLYATFRGVLEEIGDRCDGSPWCRNVDADAIEPYAADRILPAILRYSKVGLDLDDVLDDGRLGGAFIDGMLNGEERFDALKTMLQLNTFTNAVGLARALLLRAHESTCTTRLSTGWCRNRTAAIWRTRCYPVSTRRPTSMRATRTPTRNWATSSTRLAWSIASAHSRCLIACCLICEAGKKHARAGSKALWPGWTPRCRGGSLPSGALLRP